LDGVVKTQASIPPVDVGKEIAKAIGPFKENVGEAMAERTVALEERINKVKLFVVRSTKRMNEKIDAEVVDQGWDSKPPLLRRRIPSQNGY
jgi:hypothetical protein